MEYEVYLRQEVFEFLRQRRRDERDQLLAVLRQLRKDPFRRGDFSERDRSGRDIKGLVVRRFAILFWTDRAVKEVKVTEIRYADR